MKTKICSKCKVSKDVGEFCKDKTRKDGLHPWCKDCRKKDHARYYKLNKEKITKRSNSYRNKNRVVVRKNNNTSYKKHRLARQKAVREYYKKNKKLIQQKTKVRRRNNPGYWRTWKRLWLLRNCKVGHTAEDIREIYKAQKGRCYWCGTKVEKYHADHVIPLSRGGSNEKGNLVVSCPKCNLSKGSKLQEEWRNVGA